MTPCRRIAIIAFAGLLTLPLTGCLPFIGGPKNIILNLKGPPDINDRKLIARRRAAHDAIEAAFATWEPGTGFVRHAGSSSHDRCYKGQNNIKVKTGYAHRCALRVTRYYGMNGDFRSQMLDFERLLSSQQWQLPQQGLQYIMTEYYDQRIGRTMASRGRRFLVSDIPSPITAYTKNDLRLWIRYAEQDTADLFMIDVIQLVLNSGVLENQEKKAVQDVKAVFAAITATHRYVLAAAVEAIYFEN